MSEEQILQEKTIKNFNDLQEKGLSLRDIAKKLKITYYQAQLLNMKRKMRNMNTIITHYRTIYAQNQCFSLRLIPYCLLDGSLDEIENPLEHVRHLLEEETPLPMCCEIQLQPDVWFNFDCDAIYGKLEDQIHTFYKHIRLSDFSMALTMNFTTTYNPENCKLFEAALKQCCLEEPIQTLDRLGFINRRELCEELVRFTQQNHPDLNLEPYTEMLKQWKTFEG